MTGLDDTIDDGAGEQTAPVWAVFGDLMAGLLGAFVLILVCALGMQLELATRLDDEVKKRQGADRAHLYHDVWDVLYRLQTQPQTYSKSSKP